MTSAILAFATLHYPTRMNIRFKFHAIIDLARVMSMTEEEIMRTSPPDLADLTDDFWDNAVLVMPKKKVAVSLRMDSEVLAWYKATGARYQTRMNAVLKSYARRGTGVSTGSLR